MSRLIRLFPRAWRERYAAEFEALLDGVPTSIPVVVDVVFAAIRARLRSGIAAIRQMLERLGASPLGTSNGRRVGAVVAMSCGALWGLTFAIGTMVGWRRNGREQGGPRRGY